MKSVLIVIVLLVLGGAAFFLLNSRNSNSNLTENTAGGSPESSTEDSIEDSTQALAPDCAALGRKIVFAGFNWESAQLHNAIARHVLEKGFGCETEDIPGATVPMMQGLARGDIDVYMELWANNAPEIYYEAEADGRIIDLGHSSTAMEAWFVPRYVIEGDSERDIEPIAPDLKAVSDLPKYAELFSDPEEPKKGRFYNCVIGWQCEAVNNEKFVAYGLEDSFTNFKPGEGAALDSEIESLYRQGKPLVTYYWGPTWILGSFDMVALEEPEYSDECWEKDKGCAYPTGVINIAVSKDFNEQAPTEVIKFLTAYELDQQIVSDLLSYIHIEEVEVTQAVANFFENQPELWTTWVSDEVAELVKNSL